MRQPTCEEAVPITGSNTGSIPVSIPAPIPVSIPGSITERLLASGGGLDRLCEPLGNRFAAGPGDEEPGGGSFSKYPGWDEKPHPWSQRAGSGDYRAEKRSA